MRAISSGEVWQVDFGLAGVTVLKVDDSARELARAILADRLLPPAAASDAFTRSWPRKIA
jgi:hypothetical protein